MSKHTKHTQLSTPEKCKIPPLIWCNKFLSAQNPTIPSLGKFTCFIFLPPNTHLISQAGPVSPWRGTAPWTWGCRAWSTRNRHRKSRRGSASAALWHICDRRCAGRAGSEGGWRAPYISGRSVPARCSWWGPEHDETRQLKTNNIFSKRPFCHSDFFSSPHNCVILQ